MRSVALKGLIARPVRTILTTLAIVLGVAMISGALTLTDTMRGGADGLTKAAYDGTDAVVTAKTAFAVSSSDYTAKKPTVDASLLERVRSVPQVAAAVGDIHDEAKIIARDGKPAGDGPYFGVGFDSRTEAAKDTTPFRLADGRWATGAGRGRHRRLDRREAEVRHRLDGEDRRARHDEALRGRRRRQLRHRQVARHGDRRRVRPARRAGAVRQERPLRLDPRRRQGLHARRRTSARRSAPSSAPPRRCRPPRSRTASPSTG